jgi:hypothetical protein
MIDGGVAVDTMTGLLTLPADPANLLEVPLKLELLRFRLLNLRGRHFLCDQVSILDTCRIAASSGHSTKEYILSREPRIITSEPKLQNRPTPTSSRQDKARQWPPAKE